MTATVSTGDSAAPYAFETAPGFGEWLLPLGVSVVFTTYQIGKRALVGCGCTLVSERTFPRCLGVAASGSSQLQRHIALDNVEPPGDKLEDMP